MMIKKNNLSIFTNKNKIPIWFMRQAGRYLPEYRKVRASFPHFIDMCLNSQAATEVALQPLNRFEINAAILFSDILIVPYALGINVRFVEGKGPILSKITNSTQINDLSIENTENVFSKVNNVVKTLKNALIKDYKDKCLIGFAGSPWTVACYMIEGSGSKNFQHARKYAYEYEEDFNKLISILTNATIKYLIGQIENGANVIKLFDSWAGLLSEEQYNKWVIAPTEKIVSVIKNKFPNIMIIGFPRNSGIKYIKYAKRTKVDIIAVDETVSTGWVKENLQNIKIVQGNLDNVLLSSNNVKGIKESVKNIVNELRLKPFIFNLGHGVLPQTPIKNINYVIETVRKYE